MGREGNNPEYPEIAQKKNVVMFANQAVFLKEGSTQTNKKITHLLCASVDFIRRIIHHPL